MDSEKTEKKPWSKPQLDAYGSLPETAKGSGEGPQPLTKKKYSKPELVVYGNLAEITGTLGLSSPNMDNALNVTKTH
jgi:hypothetical protein